MKKMRKILMIIIFSITFLFAQAPIDSEKKTSDVMFSHAYISIEGGQIYPFGDIIDAVNNAWYGGLGFSYTYYENIDGFVHFNYSYFTVRAKDIPFPGVHQFTGRLGLDYKWKYINPVVIGAGFTCNWTRADQSETDYFKGRGGMLLDNETEFGWFARLNLPIFKTQNYNAGMNVLLEELWTLPKRSDMISVGIYLERRIW